MAIKKGVGAVAAPQSGAKKAAAVAALADVAAVDGPQSGAKKAADVAAPRSWAKKAASPQSGDAPRSGDNKVEVATAFGCDGAKHDRLLTG